jgi:inner membrane protein
MLFRTHVVGAIASGILYFQYFNYNYALQYIFTFFTALLLSAILPDIDTPKSMLGKRVPILSWLLRLIFGHRTFFHAIWLPLLLSILLADFPAFSIGIIIGYGSHLLLDSLTKQGIQPFYPFRLRLRGPLESGGFVEGIIFIGLVILGAFSAAQML